MFRYQTCSSNNNKLEKKSETQPEKLEKLDDFEHPEAKLEETPWLLGQLGLWPPFRPNWTRLFSELWDSSTQTPRIRFTRWVHSQTLLWPTSGSGQGAGWLSEGFGRSLLSSPSYFRRSGWGRSRSSLEINWISIFFLFQLRFNYPCSTVL